MNDFLRLLSCMFLFLIFVLELGISIDIHQALQPIAYSTSLSSKAASFTQDEPDDPFSGYIGYECDILGDDATPELSTFGIDQNGILWLHCSKHWYKANWSVDDSPNDYPTPRATI